MTHRILVSDPISEDGLSSIIEHPDFEVDIKTNLSEDELINEIKNYQGLIVRSQTQVTDKIINASSDLKVIARAGVGVDNIDINAATLKGILVINAPDGNTISATEHSVAMILSMARNIPQAHASLQSGQWERKAFRGTELYQKTLGVIGTGRIGLGVIKRLQSFGMSVLAYDPFLTEEKAEKLNIKLASVEEIAEQADFLTVHTPLTSKTKGMINASFFEKAKPTLQVINVARGGIINEDDLIDALNQGKIAKAAIDVFESEPPTSSPLINHEKVIVTPHLGASTIEAQEKVAISVAEEIVDIFDKGTVLHAINAPVLDFSKVSENAKQFIKVSELAAELVVQICDDAPEEIKISLSGDVVESEQDLIARSIIVQLLKSNFGERVNLINAPVLLKEQNISYQIENRKHATAFNNYIEIRLKRDEKTFIIGATVLEGFGPRIIRINEYSLDFKPNKYQIITYHEDRPGIVGQTGEILGKNGINIASMSLGRANEGGQAMMILSIDQLASDSTIESLRNTGYFNKIYGTTLTI